MTTIKEREKTVLEKAEAYHVARKSANGFRMEFAQKAWREFPTITEEPPVVFTGKFFEDWHAARAKEQLACDEYYAAWQAEKMAG